MPIAAVKLPITGHQMKELKLSFAYCNLLSFSSDQMKPLFQHTLYNRIIKWLTFSLETALLNPALLCYLFTDIHSSRPNRIWSLLSQVWRRYPFFFTRVGGWVDKSARILGCKILNWLCSCGLFPSPTEATISTSTKLEFWGFLFCLKKLAFAFWGFQFLSFFHHEQKQGVHQNFQDILRYLYIALSPTYCSFSFQAPKGLTCVWPQCSGDNIRKTLLTVYKHWAYTTS